VKEKALAVRRGLKGMKGREIPYGAGGDIAPLQKRGEVFLTEGSVCGHIEKSGFP